ncbi:DUF262 domain-containing protein [Dickeya dianthicola]|uniref:DUF262 domain-containing protein n=1 Tax=Dickeya dianthicola TaxID=204039 RepID=UPI0013700746|nr:DUF262 domain-containing protein [Dickeya dianthicola]MCI4237102.1 DUF262 domain-containing protein [Dickeya dianthicola]MCI4256030.1 DUF262 domain-containing protein [Dickeya dianthicola]MZG23669.1 DUF262 domain-containing protein [Dickeya dianthicola]MZI90750.1 DUF262 domain-containing protein [Dickeya dianthicola]
MAELASQPTSIQSIYNWFIENKLFVNRRYQRKLVWTLIEKQKLVDSILKKYPVPAILIAEREGTPGTYEIIDGLQRLHAIMSFIETSYATLDNNIFNLQFFPTAKTRADEGFFNPRIQDEMISPRDVGTFLDYPLALSVMRNATESEVNDVFDRINSYGHRLSDQERRQSGVENSFSSMVRHISCSIRGDVSNDILPLRDMPSISIDLPLTRHGYLVKADEVFWVKHGVLRSTDLRDSMDEQCIADISACVILGSPIERSKVALDRIYEQERPEYSQLNSALEVYGDVRFIEEFKYCLDEIVKVCEIGAFIKLRELIFPDANNNAYPSVFSIIFLSFYELIISGNKKITNYSDLRNRMFNIVERINIGRRAGGSDERRTNIDAVKGVIGASFVESDDPIAIYENHTGMDIENYIRRSEIELSNYELKQGMLNLNIQRTLNQDVVNRVINTICAIANNGKGTLGKIIIGVADDDNDSNRIKSLDNVEAKRIGMKNIVGVSREARALGISNEEYLTHWVNSIRNSELSEPLKTNVLSKIDYNDFYGLGVIVITIPPQNSISAVGEKIYWREADNTSLAQGLQIASIAMRFN